MKSHRSIHEIPIYNPYSSEPWLIEVKRPDYAHVVNSDFDFSGLTPIVKEVFGETKKPKTTQSQEEQENKVIYYVDDLIQRTLIQPTWQDFENMMPLTIEQKMSIVKWIFADIQHFKDIIENENVAMEILLECRKFRKQPHEVADIYGEYCGIYHRYFNRAMTEYMMYLEDGKKPISISNYDPIESIKDLTGISIGQKSQSEKNSKIIGKGLTNTEQFLKRHVK